MLNPVNILKAYAHFNYSNLMKQVFDQLKEGFGSFIFTAVELVLQSKVLILGIKHDLWAVICKETVVTHEPHGNVEMLR